MLDDNDEHKISPHIKERHFVLRFCMLLVIIGVVIALITGKQWWLALPLEVFAIIVASIYAKKGEKK